MLQAGKQTRGIKVKMWNLHFIYSFTSLFLFFSNTHIYSLGMEELDRNIHQFKQGTELWEIWPQVPLIYPVGDYLPPSHMQENNPLQYRALMWKERKAQSHSWMVKAEPISALFFSLLLLTWDQGSLICIDVYEVSLEKFFSLRVSSPMNRNKMLKYFLWKSFSFSQRKLWDIAWELEYCISAKFQTSSIDINQKVIL